MNSNLKLLIAVIFLSLAGVVSCKKDKKTDNPSPVPPPPGNEQELITTFKVYLSDGNDTTVYLFKDPDGDGGIPAFYGPGTNTNSTQSDSVIVLLANKTYTATLFLLDESKTPGDTISNEVKKEADEHMFFFNQLNPSSLPNASVTINGTNLSITYLDKDGASSPLPLGLSTKWTTGNVYGKAPLNIALKHQPGTKNGTYAPGDTDISVLFKVSIH
jgi:hypothetical protein